MASNTKLHPSFPEVLPTETEWKFPNQIVKCTKRTTRVSPLNGTTFTWQGNNNPQFSAPASGYIDNASSYFEMDVQINNVGSGVNTSAGIRFENNIQSIFRRVQVVYAGTPFEDLTEYNSKVRLKTETSGYPVDRYSPGTIAEGIGGNMINASFNGSLYKPAVTAGAVGTGAVTLLASSQLPDGAINTRYQFQGLKDSTQTSGSKSVITRRYTFKLDMGLTQTDQFIPVRHLAPQYGVQFELASPLECMYASGASTVNGATATLTSTTATLYYTILNFNWIVEAVEFDEIFERVVRQGLASSGLAVHFHGYRAYNYNIAGQSSGEVKIQDSHRSIRCIFAVLRLNTGGFGTDYHAYPFYYSATGKKIAAGANNTTVGFAGSDVSVISNFQFKIAGAYYPAQPVQVVDPLGNPSASEAWKEFEKARRSARWAIEDPSINYKKWNGQNLWDDPLLSGDASTADELNAACYCMAQDFTCGSANNLVDGINGAEQNDLSFIWSNYGGTTGGPVAWPTNTQLTFFVCYDALIVIQEGNRCELFQ